MSGARRTGNEPHAQCTDIAPEVAQCWRQALAISETARRQFGGWGILGAEGRNCLQMLFFHGEFRHSKFPTVCKLIDGNSVVIRRLLDQ